MTQAYQKIIFVSPKFGCDLRGDGSVISPFASISKAFSSLSKFTEDLQILIDKDGENKYTLLPNCELTKQMSLLKISSENKLNGNSSSDNGTVKDKKIGELPHYMDMKVQVSGWVSSIRRQSKNLMFVIIRDGTGELQCVIAGKICKSSTSIALTPESTVTFLGMIKAVPPEKVAPGGIELQCDSWTLIAAAPAGGLDSVLNEESSPDTLLNQRHLQLRTPMMIQIMKVRCRTLQAFRDHYASRGYFEMTPPTLVQTQCEGGSTLFSFNYFSQQAYLTQSSQMYLETMIPSLGNVFCIAQSYRAEQSKTRRHLAEYTHIEGEMPFLTFEKLLEALEDLVCDVLERIFNSDVGKIVHSLNPNIAPFKRPFKRMLYTDALDYLKDHKITKEDGSEYVFGDDIPEAPERKMIDKINEPVFLIKFPAELKAFYMKKDPNDLKLTESVDLLLPGVGEVIGGSMRIWDEEELFQAYKKANVDPTPYYWYTDQRKYGSCDHGGYGLGFERYLTWLLNRYHIRDVCFYPRFVGRCTP